MKYLEKALEMNEIDAEHRERTIREYEAAKERIKNLPFTLSDDADAMLSNHLVALIKRIYTGHFVDPIEEEMMNEVSEEAWKYAHIIVDPLFEAHGVAIDRSEVFLVGTHMEMAIASASAVQ